MEYGISRILLIFLSFMLGLTACTSTSAPVVEGWRQTAAQQSDYVVQPGDTLYSIAWAFDMDFRQLANLNNLASPYRVKTGQHLRMEAGQKKSTPYLVPKNSPTTPAVRFVKNPKQSLVPQNNSDKLITQPIVTNHSSSAVTSWLMPAQGKIIQRFSLAPGGNRGIEIAGREGSPVVAAAAGKVVYSGSGLRGYGNLIIIKHNDTYLSAYAYNKKLLVTEGTSVASGQLIALMGKNNAGQVRLHFEIRKNGKPVDPLLFLH